MLQRLVKSIAQAIKRELMRASAEVGMLLDGAIALSEQEIHAAAANIVDINQEARRHAAELSEVAQKLVSIGHAVRHQAAFGAAAAIRLREQNEAAARSLHITQQIASLAETIGKISMTAEILTLNGHIESARLGQAGRPFAVIVEQLRELSDQVRSANEVISKLAQSLTEVIPTIVEHSRALLNMTERFAHEQASQVEGPYEKTQEWLQTTMESSQARAQQMVARTNQILSCLQFQDRMAQDLRNVEYVVDHAERVLGTFVDQVAERDPATLTDELDAQDLLDEVYAETPRQVARLGDTLDESDGSAPPSGEVMLF